MTDPDTPEADGGEQAIFTECRARHANGEQISDACARAIAALWHGGQRSRAYAFASTGAILSDADPATDTPEDIGEHDHKRPLPAMARNLPHHHRPQRHTLHPIRSAGT